MPSIPEEPEVPENEMERLTMPDFIKPLYDLDVIEGKEAVLKCKVAGLPYPTIVWFHNGKRIDSTEDRKMTQCKSFFIRFDPPVVPKLKKNSFSVSFCSPRHPQSGHPLCVPRPRGGLQECHF